DRIVGAVFDSTLSGYSADRERTLDQSLAAAVQPVPGVMAVAFSRCGLIAGCSSSSSFHFEGNDSEPTSNRNWISPGYFAAVGIPLITGREFEASDSASSPVAVISESIARRFFPGQNPVGKRMGFKDLNTEIVGVVRDVRSITLHDLPIPMVYL